MSNNATLTTNKRILKSQFLLYYELKINSRYTLAQFWTFFGLLRESTKWFSSMERLKPRNHTKTKRSSKVRTLSFRMLSVFDVLEKWSETKLWYRNYCLRGTFSIFWSEYYYSMRFHFGAIKLTVLQL